MKKGGGNCLPIRLVRNRQAVIMEKLLRPKTTQVESYDNNTTYPKRIFLALSFLASVM